MNNYLLLFFYYFFYDFASGYDFTIQENGLQIDQPPEIGNISIIRIIIMKNDNVEGVIEFDPRYTAFEGKFSVILYICRFLFSKRFFKFIYFERERER